MVYKLQPTQIQKDQIPRLMLDLSKRAGVKCTRIDLLSDVTVVEFSDKLLDSVLIALDSYVAKLPADYGVVDTQVEKEPFELAAKIKPLLVEVTEYAKLSLAEKKVLFGIQLSDQDVSDLKAKYGG